MNPLKFFDPYNPAYVILDHADLLTIISCLQGLVSMLLVLTVTTGLCAVIGFMLLIQNMELKANIDRLVKKAKLLAEEVTGTHP